MFDEIPPELLETLPIDEALRVLKFDEISQFGGSPQRHWGPIEVIGCPWPPIPCLIVTIRIKSVDRIYWPQECGIAYNMKPIEILSIIYKACSSLFQNEEPPRELNWGRIDLERRREGYRQEEERRPRLWAERDFFRFCLNYVAQYYDWSEEDYDVSFTYSDGQMKINARNIEVYCPARGTFYGTLTFSARQLFRNIPKRFISDSVHISVRSDDRAMIVSTLLPAKWVERKHANDAIEGVDVTMKGITDAFGVNLDRTIGT